MIPRHRTVQDLVEWSYDLLDSDEQLLFARLCVFAGSFGLDAAEEVCAGRDVGKSAVSLLLANLVDKSMVQLVDEDLPRYRLLETLREYGRDRLSEADRSVLRATHAAWYLEVAERCAQSLAGSAEATAIQMLDRDFDNLRAAHRWSIEHLTSTRRCALSPHSGSIRSGACTPRSQVGPMSRSHYPTPVRMNGTRSL
jgi:predicted ATPase